MPNLAQEAHELREEVSRLRLVVQQFQPRVERAEKVSVRAVVAVSILMVLVVVLGGVVYRQAEQQTQLHSFCPMLALILGGADANTRPEGPARDRYVATIDAIQLVYNELHCSSPFVAPKIED